MNIETYHQITCRECGDVEVSDTANMTRAEFRKQLRKSKWLNQPGDRVRCYQCQQRIGGEWIRKWTGAIKSL